MRKMPTTYQIDELQKIIDNGGTGGSGVFIATLGETTFDEIQTAERAGKLVVARYLESNVPEDYIYCYLVDSSNTHYEFTNCYLDYCYWHNSSEYVKGKRINKNYWWKIEVNNGTCSITSPQSPSHTYWINFLNDLEARIINNSFIQVKTSGDPGYYVGKISYIDQLTWHTVSYVVPGNSSLSGTYTLSWNSTANKLVCTKS